MAAARGWVSPSVLPGFGLTLGFEGMFLAAIVLVPLAALVMKGASLPLAEFWRIATEPRALASYRLTFGASLIAAGVNTVFGPQGWIGSWLLPLGVKVAYTWLGVVIALTLIGVPFVVRSVQPALEEVDASLEDAAESLGAGRWMIFRRVILPTVLPSLATGFTLALARSVGEYGSVIFIAGNLPMRTEITPLLIVIKLEQYDYVGAAAIGLVMLCVSFLMLFTINAINGWRLRRVAGRR